MKQEVRSKAVEALGNPAFDGDVTWGWNTSIGEFLVFFRNDGTSVVLTYNDATLDLREYVCSAIEEFTRILEAYKERLDEHHRLLDIFLP